MASKQELGAMIENSAIAVVGAEVFEKSALTDFSTYVSDDGERFVVSITLRLPAESPEEWKTLQEIVGESAAAANVVKPEKKEEEEKGPPRAVSEIFYNGR